MKHDLPGVIHALSDAWREDHVWVFALNEFARLRVDDVSQPNRSRMLRNDDRCVRGNALDNVEQVRPLPVIGAVEIESALSSELQGQQKQPAKPGPQLQFELVERRIEKD